MGSKHATSSSVSSAVAGPSTSNHVKRRSGGQHSSPPRTQRFAASNGDGGDPSSLFGLGLEQGKGKGRATHDTTFTSRAPSLSRNASSPGPGGDEHWSSISTTTAAVHEVERGSSIEQERRNSHSSRNTPSSKLRRSTSSVVQAEHHHGSSSSSSSASSSPWKPFSPSWTPEKAQRPNTYSEDALMMGGLYSPDGYMSPYRSRAGIPSLYRSSPSSSPSSFYRSDSIPMIASTSSSSLYESTLSPSASFTTLSPSKYQADQRRNSDTTLSIAPSPPMISSSFQPHHLSSPNSLTNRTSPKSGSHRRDASLSASTRMPVSSSTSSFFASARRVNSTEVLREAASETRTVSTFKSDQARQARWRDFSWKAKKRSPSNDIDSVTGSQPLRKTSRLALAITAACLGPFSPLIFPEQATRPPSSLSKSSSGRNRHVPTTPHKGWRNRAVRLLLALYILYSVFLFTSRLFNITLPTSSHSAKQRASKLVARQFEASDYNTWQQARFRLLDVYNVAADAIGSTALRIGRQSSKAAAGDFAGDSSGANSLTNLMLLDRLPEVRRRWGETCKLQCVG